MTEAQLETLVNTLLASGQPDKIMAVKHRQVENAIIEELFDVQSRGDLFKDLTELLSYSSGLKLILIKNGVAKLIDASLLLAATPAGTWVMKGAWNASSDTTPNNGDSSVLAGYTYENGNFTSTSLLGPDRNVILPYATIRALVDNPGALLSNSSKWKITY